MVSPVALLRRQLEVMPEDDDTGLALARALVQAGKGAEALPLYDRLATPGSGYLETALADLEALAQGDGGDRASRELLGDAYARAGRLQDAMRMYRWLLDHLGG